jgi:glycine/D-amino acid oxidase-like deaminating enzyme
MGATLSNHPLLRPLDPEAAAHPRPKPEPPTAAVVGAGLVGIHVAKELADRGFDVTIYEREGSVGLGSTQYDCGVIGAPFHPTGYDAEWFNDIFLGMFPYNYRPLLTMETPWGLPFDVTYGRFFWNRFKFLRQSNVTRERITDAGNWLATESEAIVFNLLKEVPELKKAVRGGTCYDMMESGQWKPHQVVRKNNQVEVVSQLVIDPKLWTEIMASHLQKKQNVKFLFNHHVTWFQREFKWEVEFVSKLVAVPRDPKTLEKQRTMSASHDVIVITTGAKAQETTWFGMPVPIIPVATYGLIFPNNHADLSKLLPPDPKAEFGQLLEDGSIRVQRAAATVTLDLPDAIRTQQPWMLTGLSSLDVGPVQPVKRTEPSYISGLFATRLRQLRGLEMADVANDDPTVQPVRFTKAMTPDGLPIISRVGLFRNVFVCAGMGDDIARFASGSAALLGRVIDHTAKDTKENPFSLKRFGQFTDEDLKEQPLPFSMEQGENWVNDVGSPMYDRIGQWFRETPLREYVPSPIRNFAARMYQPHNSWFL